MVLDQSRRLDRIARPWLLRTTRRNAASNGCRRRPAAIAWGTCRPSTSPPLVTERAAIRSRRCRETGRGPGSCSSRARAAWARPPSRVAWRCGSPRSEEPCCWSAPTRRRISTTSSASARERRPHRSPAAARRPATCRDRSLWLAHQRHPERQRHQRPASTAPRSARAAPHPPRPRAPRPSALAPSMVHLAGAIAGRSGTRRLSGHRPLSIARCRTVAIRVSLPSGTRGSFHTGGSRSPWEAGGPCPVEGRDASWRVLLRPDR